MRQIRGRVVHPDVIANAKFSGLITRSPITSAPLDSAAALPPSQKNQSH